MADEAEVKETKAAKPAESSGKSPLVTILLLVNVGVLGAVAYLQYSFSKRDLERPSVEDVVKAQMKDKDAPAEAKVEGKEAEGTLMNLDPFTVNLAQGDGPRRYLRVNLVLKISKETKKEELELRTPQIRDTVIAMVNTKRPEDLLKTEGKLHLKEELKSAINAFLMDGKVVDVYYVQFQIN